MAASSTIGGNLERGIVVHYVAESGWGFLRHVDDMDELNNLHFEISYCDIQTPPPRVGEIVMFGVREGRSRPIVAVVYRQERNAAQATRSIHAQTQRVREQPANASSSVSPPKSQAHAKPAGSKRHDPPDASKFSIHKAVDVKWKLLAEAPSSYAGGSMPRYVYVDLDNIWVSYVRAEHLVDRFPGAQTTRDLELNLEGFTRRLAQGEAGSSVTRLVAFYYNTPERVAELLRAMSYGGVDWDVRKQETTTDTSMQLELLNAKRPCLAHPKTLVLVTGDGNIASNGMCFREIMDLYLRDGWFVEVHAWLFTMATAYIDHQREYPRNVVLRPFDDEEIGEILRSRPPRVHRINGRGDAVNPQQRKQQQQRSPQPRAAPRRAHADVVANKRFTSAPMKNEPMKPAEKVRWSTRPEQRTPQPRVAPRQAYADVVATKRYTPDPMDDEPMELVEEVRWSTRPEPKPTAWQAAAAVPGMGKGRNGGDRPEDFAEVIRRIEGPHGIRYVPDGLALLRRTGAHAVVDSIQDVDVETQCLMVTMALNEAMDAATMQQLRAKSQAEVDW